MSKRVREIVRAGANVIKVCTSGGVLSPGDSPRHAHFRPDELAVPGAEAAAAGLPVMAHAQATDGIKNAMRAGVRSIEHGIYLDDEAIDMMLAGGHLAGADAGRARTRCSTRSRTARSCPPASSPRREEVIEAHQRVLRQGGRGGREGGDGHRQRRRTARQQPRRACPDGQGRHDAVRRARRDDELRRASCSASPPRRGVLTPGKRADVVAVAGDPFDLAALRRTSARSTRTVD